MPRRGVKFFPILSSLLFWACCLLQGWKPLGFFRFHHTDASLHALTRIQDLARLSLRRRQMETLLSRRARMGVRRLLCCVLDGGPLKPHHNRTLGFGIASAWEGLDKSEN